MNYKQFSNISCYEEFEIQCDLTGISKIDVLKKIGHQTNDYYFFVSNDGITAENFMAKSGGERGRVMLAGILGIQHLINLSTNGKGLNILCLDEALSGIDSKGTMEIIGTLETLGGTILMITQNIEDVSICKNVIKIKKEKGVSSIQSSSSS